MLFRLFGFSMSIWVLLKYLEQGLAKLNALGEWEFHVLAAIALCLLLFGTRLVLLVAASIWFALCFLILLSAQYAVFYFPSAEWTLWLGLPTASLAIVLAALVRGCMHEQDRARFVAEVDWGIARVFQIGAVSALGFAALHKINRDFFDPKVSCIGLRDRLHDWWGVPPAMSAWLGPAWVIGLEASLPLLLMLWPPLGLLLTALLLFEFGSIGAPAFAAIVLTMATAFLNERDRAAIAAAGRGPVLIWIGLVVCAVAFAALAFHGAYQVSTISAFHAYALGVMVASVVALRARVRALRGGRPQVTSVPAQQSSASAPSGAASPAGRLIVALVVVASLVNGMSPYLGLKFEYSFAMLSNLRVDDDRWNSLIFPRAMRLTEHDPFLHVTKVSYLKLATGQRFGSGGILDPALYSPLLIRYRLQRAFERGVQVTFDFRYRGRDYHFVDAKDPTKLYALLERLPSQTLFQRELDLGKPQSCVH